MLGTRIGVGGAASCARGSGARAQLGVPLALLHFHVPSAQQVVPSKQGGLGPTPGFSSGLQQAGSKSSSMERWPMSQEWLAAPRRIRRTSSISAATFDVSLKASPYWMTPVAGPVTLAIAGRTAREPSGLNR